MKPYQKDHSKYESQKHCLDTAEMNYQRLYFKQIELLSDPTLDNCQKIIDLSKQILNAGKVFPFSTGAYVNTARANLFLWYQTNNNEYRVSAKAACNKALELKGVNQQALLMLYEVNLCDSNFLSACDVLKSISSTMLQQGQQQILTLYQMAINIANNGAYSPEVKEGLSKLTDTLFEIYKNHPALYGIATSFYLGIGDDVIRAYEVAKRCVEEWPNAEIYCSLGLICIYPQINRVKESIKYLEKGLILCKDDNVEYGLKSNLLTSLIKDKNWENALKLAQEIISAKPSNMNYHNYAELLKHIEKYDEAIEWCQKALFLVEDDCSLLTLADIYKRAGRYQEAIETYLRCLSTQDTSVNCMSFIDANGNDMYSVASNASIDGIKLEAFKGTIHSYMQLKEFDNAQAYVSLGKEFFSEQSEFEIWESIIPQLNDYSQAYANAKLSLEKVTTEHATQKQYFKQWAAQLMQLQSSSQSVDLDQSQNWSAFEKQMDLILFSRVVPV